MTDYLTTPAFGEEFFLRIMELKEDTPQARLRILEDLVKELKGIRMTDNDLRRYLKNKRISVAKKKEPND